MSIIAIYIKSPSDFLIIDKEYHYLKPSNDYEIKKCGDANIVYLICNISSVFMKIPLELYVLEANIGE